jgi:glutathione peroxidase-family protein
MEFARIKYGAQFPIFEEAPVNGKDTQEIYKYLRLNSILYDKEQ